MKDTYTPLELRNFAVVGHASSGKTLLSESMLVCSGRIRSEEHTSELQSLRHLRRPPRSPLFPSTPLFRSIHPWSCAISPSSATPPAARRSSPNQCLSAAAGSDRKSTRLNSSHLGISDAPRDLPSFPPRRSSALYPPGVAQFRGLRPRLQRQDAPLRINACLQRPD